VLGIGLILLFRLLGPQSAAATDIEVPEMAGREEAAAVSLLEDLGFDVEVQQVPDADVAPGLVVRTDPAAGTMAGEGATVTVFVSSGPSEVEVPRVIGDDVEAATTTLEDAGLDVTVEFEPSDTIDEDVVISQNPEPGEVVDAGTTVTLIVSGGDETIEVPDVANRSERDALLQLEEAGFSPGQIRVEREPSGDVLEGFVIETDPPAGGVVPASGIVRLIISDGAAPTVVPNVVGLFPSEARADLEELGFEVEIGEPFELPFGDPDEGTVQEQSPEAGSVLDYGSVVTLRVGRAADTISVPDVEGLAPTAARRAIEDAGLIFSRGEDVLREPGDPEIGDVVDQTPSPGSVADPDDTVTVRVAVEGAEVPDVTSMCMTPGEAQATIEAAGLIYQEVTPVEELPFDDPCDGRVVEQSPGPYSATGRVVERATVVQVRLGEAVDGVIVPDVIGDDRDTARQKILDAGLDYDEELPPGEPAEAVDQDPNAGTEVAPGSVVTVTYAQATTTTTTTATVDGSG
jgi:beta-lactam-binding protein with PASTA domain